MTSKEFIRRKQYFSYLDRAASVFIPGLPLVPELYRVDCVLPLGKHIITFTPSLELLDDSIKCSCFVSLYLERYDYSAFCTEFKYFKSFVSRLSSLQLSSLRSSGCCSHLFALYDSCK